MLKKLNEEAEAGDKTGIEVMERETEWGWLRKYQDFWNVRGLAGKENELERLNLDVLGITKAEKTDFKEIGDHLLIYEGTSGNNRAKERIRRIINKKYKRFISTWIGETESILRMELKMKENVTVIVTYGLNQDEMTRDKDDSWVKFNLAIENAEDRLIIIGDLMQES